ncbi:hypothetical protein [Breoghania sp.]|uniref:hypothetical protein n=1 Tax=Breoghania sp. TaxID=2065378 RepID=UPI00261DA68E|nr:hypothetical protein [Breoghania sp.]MDJ0933330.1 hypothetical protein [Breoghania sp.]
MKAVSLYSPYAWRGRIGLVVPSTNTVNEPEFYRMAPEGIGIYTAHALLLGAASHDSYNAMKRTSPSPQSSLRRPRLT